MAYLLTVLVEAQAPVSQPHKRIWWLHFNEAQLSERL